MSLGDEFAQSALDKIKRVSNYIFRVIANKVVSNFRNKQSFKPQKMGLNNLTSKFSSIEKLGIQSHNIKKVEKVFRKNKISYALENDINKNSYSLYYPTQDIMKVEKAMEKILDEQLANIQKINDKNKTFYKKYDNKKEPIGVTLDDKIKQVEKKYQEIQKEQSKNISKVKFVSKGDIEL